jgi:hypothetical protein
MKKININYAPQLIEAMKNIENCRGSIVKFGEAEHELIQLIKNLIYNNRESDIQKAINVLKHKNKIEAANKLFYWANFISNNINVNIPEKNINALAMLVSIPVILFFDKNKTVKVNNIHELQSKIHESLKKSKLVTEKSDIFLLPQLLSLKKALMPASAKRAIIEDMLKCLYRNESNNTDIEYIYKLQDDFLKEEDQDDLDVLENETIAVRWMLMIVVDKPEDNKYGFDIIDYLDFNNKKNEAANTQGQTKEFEKNIEETLLASCNGVSRAISGAPLRLNDAIISGSSMHLALKVKNNLEKINFNKNLPVSILIFPKRKKEEVELNISIKQGDLVTSMMLTTQTKDVPFDLNVVFVALISAGVNESDIKIANSNIKPDQCFFSKTHQCYLQLES